MGSEFIANADWIQTRENGPTIIVMMGEVYWVAFLEHNEQEDASWFKFIS